MFCPFSARVCSLIHARRWRNEAALVTGLTLVFALEAVFLAAGSSGTLSVRTMVYIALGALLAVLFLAYVLSWVQDVKTIAEWIRSRSRSRG